MSKPKLKQGGMAFIVKCPTQPLNIGLPVTLLEPYLDSWYCGGNIKPAPGTKKFADEVPYSRTLVPAMWLSPIDGDNNGEDESLSWKRVPRLTSPMPRCRHHKKEKA